MRARGRPILGAISGLFLGAFVAVDLQQFGIRPLDNLSVFGLPAVGLVLGLALGLWGPFRRKSARAAAADRAAPAGEQAADDAEDEPAG